MTPPDSSRRLGRGLGALLAPTPAVPTQDIAASAVPRILIADILPNPFQPRRAFDPAELESLAASLKTSGLLQPIAVRIAKDATTSAGAAARRPRYELLAGERRLRAATNLGWTDIPAIVKEADDRTALTLALVENLQRTDLNPMEQARAYDRLAHQFKMTQEQMAQRTGKDRASVANFLRLLRLPMEVQQKVETGNLSFGHARTLLALESPEAILKAAQKVSALSMSVRQTETYVQGLLNPEKKTKGEEKEKPPLDPNVREARDQLQRALGLKVTIEDKNGRGRVIIEYSRLEDFDALLETIAGK
jgi:ParB family transcriptional regulator, chromosome partitioning protein